MFIDYVPLMLINMAGGLCLLAACLRKASNPVVEKHWASGFFMSGAVALACGFHMIFNWPLPGSYNVAFGELSVLLGILFAGAGIAIARGWNLFPVIMYGFFAGIAAVIVGFRIITLDMTREPFLSGIGFILTGLAGILLPLAYWIRKQFFRWLIILCLVSAAVIWLRTGYMAFWSHLSDLSKWVPATMR